MWVFAVLNQCPGTTPNLWNRLRWRHSLRRGDEPKLEKRERPNRLHESKHLRRRFCRWRVPWKRHFHKPDFYLHWSMASRLLWRLRGQVWRDGSRYEGNFKQGLEHGLGMFLWVNGNKYQGDWNYGRRTGNGTIWFANGDLYTGAFLNDKMHGQGQFKSKSGSRYNGEFVKWKKHGKGVLHLKNGQLLCARWKSGKMI